jgi:hypothetical protein
MMDERQVMQVRTGCLGGRSDRPKEAGRGISIRVIGLLTVVLLAGNSAFADFFVQPMILRMTAQPGQRYVREMKLENSDPQSAETLTLRLAELTQKPDGSWMELRAGDPNLSKAVIRSCKDWLTVPENNIQVPAYQIVPFNLQVNVPPGTRGFYFASIIATTAPRLIETSQGVVNAVNVEMVIPIILEIQNIPMPRRIGLTGVGLDAQVQTEQAPAASNIIVDIANNGGSFSRLLPVVRVSAQEGTHWRRISEVKLPELVIMPGVKLHVKQDAGQALPSGNYRLDAFLFVDGLRGPRISNEVVFKGDPRIPSTGLKGDIPLTMQPAPLFIEMVPGAARSAVVNVLNGSEDEITINAEAVLPPHMESAQVQGIRGDDLSCANWVTVNPSKFTLKGHSRRSIGILARMPKEAGKYPSYYADLKLHLFYADGKAAGTKETWICVENKPVTGTPSLEAKVLTVSETSPSRYLVTGAFGNYGATHVNSLTCQGYLSVVGGGGVGASIYKRFQMTCEAVGQTGILLPFQTRSFSGVLDVSDVPENDYYVTAVLNWPGGPADGVQKQLVIKVKEQGGRKVASMQTAGGPPVVIKM